jgi:hypothetical protein
MPLVPHAPAAESEAHASQIVALDAGDLAGADLQRAEALLVLCAGCVALRDDLGAIREAMTSLPAPARRRDFRLTEADAARLRPSGWRQLVGWLAAPGSSVRPLATGLATLGVVGLLLTAGLPGFGAGVATLSAVGESVDQAGAPEGTSDGIRAEASGTEAPALAPGEAPVPGLAGEASPAASADPGITTQGDRNTGGEPQEYAAGDKETAAGPTAVQPEPGPSALPILSLGLLAAGLGLLLARALALRRVA